MDVRDATLVHTEALSASAQPLPSTQQAQEALKDIAFGSTAGVAGKFVEYPFDTVKVRLQSQPDHLPLRYTGPLDCFRQSLHRDGVRGLYRGISAPLFGAAVETSSLFFSYRLAQNIMQATILPGADPLPLTALVACGAISGAFTSLLLTPIELIKCKMQVPLETIGGTLSRPRPLTLIAAIYRHHGMSGFWHGQTGTLIREMGGSAAWFGGYESVLLAFRKLRQQQQSQLSSAMTTQDDSAPLPLYQQLLAGAVAGMSYNFIFYPADTIKSRMQTEEVGATVGGQRKSFGSVGKALWNQHGLKGMYRGCGITVFRSAPSSALIFSIYEFLKRTFP